MSELKFLDSFKLRCDQSASLREPDWLEVMKNVFSLNISWEQCLAPPSPSLKLNTVTETSTL